MRVEQTARLEEKTETPDVYTIRFGFLVGQLLAATEGPDLDQLSNTHDRLHVIEIALDRWPMVVAQLSLVSSTKERVWATTNSLKSEWDCGSATIEHAGVGNFLRRVRNHVEQLRNDLIATGVSELDRSLFELGVCLGHSHFALPQLEPDPDDDPRDAIFKMSASERSWQFVEQPLLERSLSLVGLTLDQLVVRPHDTEADQRSSSYPDRYAVWSEIENAIDRLFKPSPISTAVFQDDFPGLKLGPDHNSRIERLIGTDSPGIDLTKPQFLLFKFFLGRKESHFTVTKSELKGHWSKITDSSVAPDDHTISSAISELNKKLAILKLKITLVSKGKHTRWRLIDSVNDSASQRT